MTTDVPADGVIAKTPILKIGNGIGRRDTVIIKPQPSGDSLKHNSQQNSWRVLGIGREDINLDYQNKTGLIVKVRLNAINQQTGQNYLVVDEVVHEFDSSLLDDVHPPNDDGPEPNTQNPEGSAGQTVSNSDPDKMREIDPSKF